MMPPLSVVITAHEQCEQLRSHLPAILEQDYDGDFEVIVVDMNSGDDTLQVLEQMQSRYSHLHVIATPSSARNVSPQRLALTLGFRSASHDWVVLTQASCTPATPRWLSRMAEAATADKETQMVLGYTRFVDGRGWNGLRCRFFRAWQQLLHLPYAHNHRAYRADGTNLCYHRSLFMEHRGFADHAHLLAGATDIMVNHHSTQSNTAVCLHPEAIVRQQTPAYGRWWNEERLFFMETRHHFRQGLPYRLRYMASVVFTWLPTLLLCAALIAGLLQQHYIVAGAALAAWLLYMVCRTYAYNRATKPLGEPPVILALPLLLHLVPLWDATAWLRWLFTKRQTFRKKFI